MINKIKRTFGFILAHKLASKNKLKALKELLHWQLQTLFFPNKYFRKKFAGDITVLVNKGQTGMTGNLYTGLHEFEDMAFLLHLLRPEDIFVDAGANVGSYTLLASGIVGSKTFAFEPVISTFRNLENNVSVNQLSPLVKLHNMGLSSKRGTLRFSTLNDTTNHVLRSDDKTNSIEIEVNSLDELLQNNCPQLIKIDVEGFETEVLKGARSIVQNNTLKAIIIELNGSGNSYGYNDIDIHKDLVERGFKPADYDPFHRIIHYKNLFGESNTIYIRDAEFVEQRVKTSRFYKVFGVEL